MIVSCNKHIKKSLPSCLLLNWYEVVITPYKYITFIYIYLYQVEQRKQQRLAIAEVVIKVLRHPNDFIPSSWVVYHPKIRQQPRPTTRRRMIILPMVLLARPNLPECHCKCHPIPIRMPLQMSYVFVVCSWWRYPNH